MCSSMIWRRDIYLLYLWTHHWSASLSVGVFTYEFGVDPRMFFGKPSMLATVNSTGLEFLWVGASVVLWCAGGSCVEIATTRRGS